MSQTLSCVPSSGTSPLSRFQLARWPLQLMDRAGLHRAPDQPFGPKAAATRYPFRMLRYWWATAAMAQFAAKAGRPTVLDAGCQGGHLKRFAERSVDASWIGLDCRLDDPRLQEARYDRLVQAWLGEPLPLPGASCDIVVALHVLEHVPAPGLALAEFARVLRPGGWMLLGFPTMPGWLAAWREARHRRGIETGTRPDWGHQQVFHPQRCRQLGRELGLETLWVSGSHFFRRTGSPLENSAAWVRLNQWWGGCFPSLGSELCVIYRKRVADSGHRSPYAAPTPLPVVPDKRWGTDPDWRTAAVPP